MTAGKPSRDPLAWLRGGGAMGALIQSRDWQGHAMGPPETWSVSLRAALSICLSSRFPMILWWGPAYNILYNDAYIPTLGRKHPQAFGEPGYIVWAEIWDVIGTMLQHVRTQGEACWCEDERLFLQRSGYREETYHTFSYSPVRDDAGDVVGVFTAVTETTLQVLGQRRLHTLREIAARTSRTRTVAEACEAASAGMGERAEDIPFAAVYLFETSQYDTLTLRSTVRLSEHHAAAPAQLPIDTSLWPVQQCLSEGLVLTPLTGTLQQLPGGCWNESPQLAAVLPLTTGEGDKPTGVLIFGVNPRRAFDDDYRGFAELVAANLATAVARARAYEDEKRRAEALAELDRAKTTFFSNVSHEFRTPLTLMLGPIDALMQDVDALSAPVRTHVQLLQRNAQRLLKLVNTLLDFSRIEAGRMQAHYAPTPLDQLTADLASSFRSTIEQAHMQLRVECPPLSGPVYVDRDMWEKIVLNLLSNAYKYTLQGVISVSLRESGHHVVLAVQDTGVGIAENEQARLFERFHRVEGARGRTHEGTGIGLALVHELVKLHGGNVSVHSVVDQGSTFTVQIPMGYQHLPSAHVSLQPREAVSDASRQALVETLRTLPGVAEAPLAQAPEGAAHILLADDNADMRGYVHRLLAPHYRITVVGDGQQALAAALQNPPDLVLSDIMMPELDGVGLLTALRQQTHLRTIPVILLSARAGEEARIEGLQSGADDYLVKPFSARELLARVAGHLELARVRREAALERERLLAREREAVRHRDEFLGIASHELRTPVTSLCLQLQLTERAAARAGSIKEVPDDRLARMMDTFSRQLGTLRGLIDDLLDVSRIANGRLLIEPQSMDLAQLTADMLEQAREQLESAGCQISFAAPQPVVGCWDPKRLEQVVTNLLSNAAKYAPGAPVDIRVVRVGDHARLQVFDRGMGISEANQRKVFERFERAVSRHNVSGLGLGLYIVKEIVSAHLGSIMVRSQEGEGAEFTVDLPLRLQSPRAS